jgi:hypothetical protein
MIYMPLINLILQGGESMTAGEHTLHYDPATYFVLSVDLPAVGWARPAESGEPYLAVALTLEPAVVEAMLADLPVLPKDQPCDTGLSVAPVTRELMDAGSYATHHGSAGGPCGTCTCLRTGNPSPRFAGTAREQAARYRMLMQGAKKVTAVAFEVGYESANQFSREYAPAFGLSPLRGMSRILCAAGATNGHTCHA